LAPPDRIIRGISTIPRKISGISFKSTLVIADHPELFETKYLNPYYYYEWAFNFAQDYVLLAGF